MLDKLNPLGAPVQDGAADLDKAPVAPAADPADPRTDKAYVAKATKAAVEFESFFISHMLQQMRESARTLAPEDSAMKDPVNSDMLDMADKMLAGHMAGQRAFGVADAILKQLLPPGLNKAG
ncbi:MULTISPECIES: rod-binding protein [unclassified Massilia]|uniref:rod-binding protein n=1 Tax=unclassified Massilia TaxID=2609279 RepID=UPI0009E9A79D|nr:MULTISPECIES: rod-binding protein [unclassified Massilia]